MTNPKDLDELLVALVNKTEEHLEHSGRTVDSDHIKQTKAQILKHYRSVSDIKKAVGEMEAVGREWSKLDKETQQNLVPEDLEDGIIARNQLRKEILTALGIEEDK